jgi:hypothetical protein
MVVAEILEPNKLGYGAHFKPAFMSGDSSGDGSVPTDDEPTPDEEEETPPAEDEEGDTVFPSPEEERPKEPPK